MNNGDLSWKVHITTLPDIKNTKKNLGDNANKHHHRQKKKTEVKHQFCTNIWQRVYWVQVMGEWTNATICNSS